MSHHKAVSQIDSQIPLKYHAQVRTLKELFSDWTNDDLHSALIEANGDAELAATRITDGVAVQWGSVSRKKDKKTTPAPSTKEHASSRGESRGARGGRGGRGGHGRGGAAVRGRSGHSRGGPVNGHARTTSPRPADASTSASASSAQLEPSDVAKPSTEVNGFTNAWTDHKPAQSEVSNAAAAPKHTDVDTHASAPVHVAPIKQAPKHPAPAPGPAKLSWAQIASKPTPKLAPPQPLQQPASTPLQQPLNPAASAPPKEPDQELQPTGWEEPTTVQPPSWDPETSQSTPAVDLPAEEPKPEPPAPSVVPEKFEEPSKPSALAPEAVVESTPAKVDAPSQAPAPSLPTPALTSSVAATPSPKLASRTAALSSRASARNRTTDQPVVMPSSFGSVEKVGMQFGSLSLSGENLFESSPTEPEVPTNTAPATEPAASTTTPNKPQYETPSSSVPPATAPAASASLGSVFQQQQQQAQQTLPAQPQQPQQSAAGTQPISHQTLSTSVSQPTQSTQTSTHAAAAAAAAAASPLQQYPHQPQAQQPQQQPLVNLQQQQPQQPQAQQQQNHHQLPQHQHLPQQVQQSHTHHQYPQHLPAQLESQQQQQHLPSTTQQPQSATAHSSYFRQNEASSTAPYFHTPTPPAGQAQESPYGAFNQISGQNQHQQASHLGGFGSADYGYDNQRGFYDNYPQQQTGFGNRNVLGHEDIKGLPGNQQQPAANSLPPSATQTSQHTSQSANQPQSAGGQGPQPFPPPPVQYYYNPYQQNQYYGAPYSSGYVPQPYVKYPTMFQHGPPGANSASSAGKQPGANVNVVQPQNNPYNHSPLYQQGGYDDYQQHPHLPQQQHSHALGLGQSGVGLGGGNDYGKPLYGAGGQGFAGLSGQSGGASSGVSGAGSGPRSASSPEAAYKYQKDGGIGVGGGRGASVQGGPGQGQPQGQGAGQSGQGGPQGQGYYGANRFSGGGVGGIGGGAGPQQNAHHQQGGPQGHLGYPQGANDGSFYPYQRQQGYWQ